MTRSRSDLADAVEATLAGGRASVTETADALILYQLDGREARRLHPLFAAAGWTDLSIVDEGGDLPIDAVQDEDEGVSIRAGKPDVPAGLEALLTRQGLEAALSRADLSGRLWVHGLNAAFETATVRYAPWGDDSAFAPVDAPASPRAVVRVLFDDGGFPDDLGRWLLRDPAVDVAGRGIEPWRRMALERLCLALADEVEPDGRLLFRGPPAARFRPEAAGMVEAGPLAAIERAAAWVFGNPREVENRHVLFAAEIARTALQGGDVGALAEVAGPALGGARIAYGFGVAQQSRETLKALSDLRKAVGDETGRLTDSTRGLIAAVAAAVFGNVGIIVARLSIAQNSRWVPAAAVALGIVIALYVLGVVLSGFQFLRLQAKLRSEWRQRLYRFLEPEEYGRMVDEPIATAERAFRITAAVSGVMVFLMLFAVWRVAGR